MKPYSIAILIGLSACASVPGGNDVSARTASWQGATVAELVAVLGQPGRSKQDKLYWQFHAPGHDHGHGHGGQRSSRNTGSLSVLSSCSSCASSNSQGDPTSGAMPFSKTVTYGGGSGGGLTVPRLCTYIAYVDGGAITRLTTLSKPGVHCQFEELPLHSSE